MGEKIATNNMIALILVFVAMLAFGGCTYRVYNPNCDLTGLDQYREFVGAFDECVKDETKCGKFVHTNVPENSDIVLESSGGITDVKLRCGTDFGKTEPFDVGLCEYSLFDENVNDLDSIRISRGGNSYSENGMVELKNIDGNVCFVEPYPRFYPSEGSA